MDIMREIDDGFGVNDHTMKICTKWMMIWKQENNGYIENLYYKSRVDDMLL